MRIGIDCIPLAFPKTGIGHYTFELAQALARISPEDDFNLVYPSTFPPIITAEFPRPSNLNFIRVNVGPFGRNWWSIGLPHYVRQHPLDLFHGTNYDIPLWRRCRTVLSVHDLSQLLHPQTHQERSVRRARRRLPLMMKTADAVITGTETVRREISAKLGGGEKIFAVPDAVRDCFRPMKIEETTEVRRRLGVSDYFILAVGTIEPRKNLGLLISAFEELSRERSSRQLQLVIAGGRGWLSDQLFSTIKDSPLRDRIILTDYLLDEELRALYSSCVLFVYPSLYEGFGLPPLEAMSCGAPVIVSDIPVLVETTGQAARLIDPHSVFDLARNISELLRNDGERSRLAALGRKWAVQFSWERTARQTLSVYKQVMQ